MTDITSNAVTAAPERAEGSLPPALAAALRWLAILAVAMSIGFPILLLCFSRIFVVAFISDDAYYYFNVARHMASGFGPSADGVTYTTGFHPLYAFILAGIHWLTNPSLDFFIREAIVLNTLASIATAGFLFLAARRWWNRRAGILTALLWLAGAHSTFLVGIGLEGCVYAMTLSFLLWRSVETVLGPGKTGGTSSWFGHTAVLGIAGGLTILSRTDAMAVIPLIAIVLLSCRSVRLPARIGGIVLFLVVAGALMSTWFAYAYHYTGSILQGSAATKAAWRAARLAQEREQYGPIIPYLMSFGPWAEFVYKSFLKVAALKWVVTGVPMLFRDDESKRPLPQRLLLHTLWVFPIGLGFAYGFFLDRAWTWYYAPSLVTLTLMTGGAGVMLYERAPRHRIQAAAKKCLPLLAWLVVIENAAIFGRNAVLGRSMHQVVTGAGAAIFVDNTFPPGTRLGGWHSGIIQYYTPEQTVINLDGLANNDIQRVLHGEMTMNEYIEKMDIQVLLGRSRQLVGDAEPTGPHDRLLEVSPDDGGLIRIVIPTDETGTDIPTNPLAGKAKPAK